MDTSKELITISKFQYDLLLNYAQRGLNNEKKEFLANQEIKKKALKFLEEESIKGKNEKRY